MATFHKDATGADLHESKVTVLANTPVALSTAASIAGIVVADNQSRLWKANSTTAGDWAMAYGGAWQTWTPVWTGFSVDPVPAYARYMQLGKIVFAEMQTSSNGTSNATTFTVTLPVAARGNTYIPVFALDNGNNSISMLNLQTASNVAQVFFGPNIAAWTASGAKTVRFSISYEAQ